MQSDASCARTTDEPIAFVADRYAAPDARSLDWMGGEGTVSWAGAAGSLKIFNGPRFRRGCFPRKRTNGPPDGSGHFGDTARLGCAEPPVYSQFPLYSTSCDRAHGLHS